MALETQFETMRQIFDLVPHFLFAKDGDSRFLLVNQTMAAAHGMTAEEMVGRTMDEVYDDPALVAHYRADDLDVIKGGKSKYISEEPFVDALGAEKTLETTKIPFKDPDSGKPAVLCVSLDITGRRRAEEALRESRAHLNDAQRLAHIGSWTWDIATGKLQWSEEHYRIFGVEPVGRPITFGEALAMVHPDDRAMTEEALSSSSHTGASYDIEYRIRRPDGETRFIQNRGTTVTDDARKPTAMHGTAQDISARKVAEIEANRFREAVDNASEGFVLYDSDERLVFANKRYREIYPEIAHLLVPGAKADDNRRAFILSGAVPAAVDRENEFINDILRQQIADSRFEVELGNGRWINYSDHVLPDGGRVSLRTDITDIKRREEELRESEQSLSHHITGTPLAAIVWNVDGTVREWNPAAEIIFGYSTEEALGSHANDLIIPERHIDLVAEIFQSQLDQKGGDRTVNENMTKDGSIVFIEWYNTPLQDVQGKTTGVASLALDITERKNAEQALSESEARFRTIFEDSAFGISIATVDDRILTCNPALTTLLGYELGELDGVPWTRYTHPDDVAENRRLSDQLNRREIESFQMEKRFLRKDGTVLWAHITGSIVGDDIESARFRVAMVQDISERKQAEAALRESEGRLSEAQRIAQIGSWVNDERTGILSWSDEMYRIFGVPQDGINPVLENTLDLVHPADRDRVAKAREEMATSVEDYTYVFRILSPDGNIKHVRAIGSPRPDGQDTVFHRAGTLQDITEQVKAEEWLRHAEQTEALAGLAGGIAHEINNMLTPIAILTSHTINSLPVDGQEGRNLEIVRKSAERASAIVKGMLTFSRQDVTPEQLPEDIAAILNESMALIGTALPKYVTLRQNVGTIPRPVVVNATQMHQLIMNLAKNAFDAVGNEPGEVIISLEEIHLSDALATVDAELRPGNYARITLKDSGCGMKPETVGNIFRPFFTTKEVGSGTGLGLSMVHGIVLDHGGGITVESQPDKGSTFCVYLPLVDDADRNRLKLPGKT